MPHHRAISFNYSKSPEAFNALYVAETFCSHAHALLLLKIITSRSGFAQQVKLNDENGLIIAVSINTALKNPSVEFITTQLQNIIVTYINYMNYNKDSLS